MFNLFRSFQRSIWHHQRIWFRRFRRLGRWWGLLRLFCWCWLDRRLRCHGRHLRHQITGLHLIRGSIGWRGLWLRHRRCLIIIRRSRIGRPRCWRFRRKYRILSWIRRIRDRRLFVCRLWWGDQLHLSINLTKLQWCPRCVRVIPGQRRGPWSWFGPKPWSSSWILGVRTCFSLSWRAFGRTILRHLQMIHHQSHQSHRNHRNHWSHQSHQNHWSHRNHQNHQNHHCRLRRLQLGRHIHILHWIHHCRFRLRIRLRLGWQDRHCNHYRLHRRSLHRHRCGLRFWLTIIRGSAWLGPRRRFGWTTGWSFLHMSLRRLLIRSSYLQGRLRNRQGCLPRRIIFPIIRLSWPGWLR